MFHSYAQNNSCGSLTVNDEVANFVFIEADDSDQADEIACKIGIYFNGVDDGLDCECCGDRWYSSGSEGEAEPKIYGESIAEYRDVLNTKVGEPYAHVYYKDGRKETFVTKKS